MQVGVTVIRSNLDLNSYCVYLRNGVNEISLTIYLSLRQEKLVCATCLKVTHASLSHYNTICIWFIILSSSTCNNVEIFLCQVDTLLNNTVLCKLMWTRGNFFRFIYIYFIT